MPRIPGLRRVFRLATRRAPVQDDIDAELAFHFARAVEDLVARGRSPQEARAEAERRFGDVVARRAELRRIDERADRARRLGERLHDVAHSLRRTARVVRRRPGLAAAVALTLAVGVGALTAAVGVVDAALLREPPFADAQAIAVLKLVRHPAGGPPEPENWSFARFVALRARQRSFAHVATYTNPSATLTGEGEPELVTSEVVSPSYFAVLRVPAARGRVFAEDEDDPDRPAPVVLVSRALWARRWGADPSLVGRVIRVNGVPLTVVGVLPDGFRGLSGGADLWLTDAMAPRVTYADYLRTNQNFINVVGRLRDGVSLDDARRELGVLGAVVNRAAPSDPTRPSERASATAIALNTARVDPLVRRALLVLLGGVAALHLLACANVANLLLGHAAGRRRETAVRAALGSGARRLFADGLVELLALAVPGAVLGVAVAWWACRASPPPAAVWATNTFARIAPFDTPAFGARELGVGLALAVVSSLLVTLPAALSAIRLDVPREIKTGARGIAGGALRLTRPTLRGVLVALEATLAMLLVVSAGLLLDSFQRIRGLEIGATTSNVLSFWVVPPVGSVPPNGDVAYVSRLLAAMSAVPGVRSASVGDGAPLTGAPRTGAQPVGRASPAGPPTLLHHRVGPDHFLTLGIPLRRGRAFGPGDVAGSPRVAVISETAARRLWPAEDPIGKRLLLGGGGGASADSTLEVVGVVGDVLYSPLEGPPNRASVYTPYTQFTYAARLVLLRTAGDPRSVLPAARRALQAVDPNVAMRDVRTLDEIVLSARAGRGVGAALFGGFGVASLLLAASGIFAVLAHAVAARTGEFGIRLALGADAASVLRLVLREGLAYPAVGLVGGVAASLVATRALRSALYEVVPLEPRVYAATVLLLLAACVAACLGPAWRATRVDPVTALRTP